MKALNRMPSLASLIKSYRNRKNQIAKLRKKTEKKLKEAISQKRRSTSGLASVERHKEEAKRRIGQLNQLLNQSLARMDSIERLKTAAEERLQREQNSKDEVLQEAEYGTHEEKAKVEERIQIIEAKIRELLSEIKEREAGQRKMVIETESLKKEKTRLEVQLRKQTSAKPVLLNMLKSSERMATSLKPKVNSLQRREGQTAKQLHSIVKKSIAAEAVRKKARRKRAAMKASAARKARAAKRARVAKKTRSKKGKIKKKTKTRTRTLRRAKRKVARKAKRRPAKKIRRPSRRKAKARRSRGRRK